MTETAYSTKGKRGDDKKAARNCGDPRSVRREDTVVAVLLPNKVVAVIAR